VRPAAEEFAPFTLRAGALKLRAARFDGGGAGGNKVCVLLNGQTEFIEKYFEVIDDLRRRGFSVVTLDWRGQGGSDRLLANPLKAHIHDFAQYDEDLAILLREVVAPMLRDGHRPIALAHSMGGHLLLRRLHKVRHEFSAAAMCAPMITIQPRKVPWWVTRLLSRIINREAPSEAFVWGMAERDHLTLSFDRQIVTSDPVRYQRTHDALVANPALRLNGPTWGWLAAALKSILALHQPGYAEAIPTPCLLFAAGHDQVCNSPSLQAFAARMPKAHAVEIAGAQHEILQERDVFRDQLWTAFDAFMADK
jgi:lysophospholipase